MKLNINNLFEKLKEHMSEEQAALIIMSCAEKEEPPPVPFIYEKSKWDIQDLKYKATCCRKKTCGC